MDGSIFIPSREVRKEIRKGGGSPFQDDFWIQFNSQAEYDKRKQKLASSVDEIVGSKLPDGANLYAEVTYTELSTSKSNRPTTIWQESNLEVIQSIDNKTFTVMGKRDDYSKLESIIASADFHIAKGEASTGEKIKTKPKNLNREVYAVSAIRDKNSGLRNRLDKSLMESVNLGAIGELDCVIELYQDRRLNEYDQLYQRLNGLISDDKLRKRDLKAIEGNNLSYFAELTVDDIKYLLQDDNYNFIRLIRRSPEYTASRSVTNIDSSAWALGRPVTDEVIGIIDSGITSPLFNSLRFNTESYAGKYTIASKEHGTTVASRALFGDSIRAIVEGGNPALNPVGKFLDVQVMFAKNNGDDTTTCDDDELLKAIEEVTDRYPDIKIYNLSISDSRGLDERFPNELTAKLDTIAREKDVLFICVTGNNSLAGMVEYNDIFTQHKSGSLLLPPGDTMSNLTVGSYAELSDSEAAATKLWPSPFTMRGLLRDRVRKPDVVDSGGNFLNMGAIAKLGGEPKRVSEVSRDKYGVIVIGPDGLKRANGTSLSAPLVTNKAARVLDAIKKTDILEKLPCDGNIANMVKALVVHSTSLSEEPRIRDEVIKSALGFGVPATDLLLTNSDDKVTILYCDKLDGVSKKHKLGFNLPDFVVNGDVKFTFTLAYNPPVTQNHAKYSMIDVSGSVRVPYDNPEDPLKPLYQHINSKSKRNFTTLGSGLYHFSKRQRRGLKSDEVEVLVQMYLFDEYEQRYANKMDEVEQPYAIALTIEDMSASGKLKQEMLLSSQIESLVRVGVTVS